MKLVASKIALKDPFDEETIDRAEIEALKKSLSVVTSPHDMRDSGYYRSGSRSEKHSSGSARICGGSKKPGAFYTRSYASTPSHFASNKMTTAIYKEAHSRSDTKIVSSRMKPAKMSAESWMDDTTGSSTDSGKETVTVADKRKSEIIGEFTKGKMSLSRRI